MERDGQPGSSPVDLALEVILLWVSIHYTLHPTVHTGVLWCHQAGCEQESVGRLNQFQLICSALCADHCVIGGLAADNNTANTRQTIYCFSSSVHVWRTTQTIYAVYA